MSTTADGTTTGTGVARLGRDIMTGGQLLVGQVRHPVADAGTPAALLPLELLDDDPPRLPRQVDGRTIRDGAA